MCVQLMQKMCSNSMDLGKCSYLNKSGIKKLPVKVKLFDDHNNISDSHVLWARNMMLFHGLIQTTPDP